MSVSWESSLGSVAAAIEGHATVGIQQAGDELLRLAQNVVPYDQGDLSRSGLVTVSGTQGVVSFDTPYAVIQHERSDFRHDIGQALYLRSPLEQHAERLIRVIADAVLHGLA